MAKAHDFDEAEATAPLSSNDEVDRAERSLRQALLLARDRMADRDDVVVEMKAAERGRLELLVEELRTLIDDVDPEDHRFEFGLSNGPRPRLWIDATTFVQMGADRRTYRLLKDRLHDRRLLAETAELNIMADAVSAYVADRVLDRKRAMEGEWEALRETAARDSGPTRPRREERKRSWFGGFAVGFLQVVAALALVALVLAGLVLLFPNYFPD